MRAQDLSDFDSSSGRRYSKYMALIPIKDRHGNAKAYARVDDEICDWVTEFSWSVGKDGYVRTRPIVLGRVGYVALHNLIFGKAPEGMYVDHINGDKLDNRTENLRFVTPAQSNWNTGVRKHNLSGFKGVSNSKYGWRVRMEVEGETYRRGPFKTFEQACEVSESMSKSLQGDFAPSRMRLGRAR